MRACETSRDVEPHKQVGLSPLVASRRPRGAERNGLAWKPVAEDHRQALRALRGKEPVEPGTRGAKGALGPLVWKQFTGCLVPRRGVAFASERKQPGAFETT